MSITTVLNTATSGLMAAQLGIRTVSDNVANANTPGYVRKVVNQTSLVTHGEGSGVHVEGVRRVVDQYLQSAGLTAGSAAGNANVLSEMLDRVQGLFGDPSGNTGFFSGLDQALSSFGALANDPASSLQRSQSLSTLQTFFDESRRIAGSLVQIRQEADIRLNSEVNHANDLLAQIARLNIDIRHAVIGGSDASGSENIQSQLLDELAGLIDLQAQPSSGGGIVVRTKDGMLLADERSATLSYNSSATAAGYLTVSPANGGGQTFDAAFSSGEIIGLLQSRNKEVPAALSQLAEFTSAAAREINRAHNQNSSVPAPPSLNGRATGIDQFYALSGFTGKTTVALLDSSNVLQNRVDIDFDAGTMSLNGGAATAFTPFSFVNVLNTKLGANGTASFSGDGALSIAATSGGVAVQDDATTPATKAGQGFSQYFGLNDLIRSDAYPANTGLAPTDAHGFITGQTISLRLSSPTGERLRDVTVAIPPGTNMNSLLNALNATGTGVAPFGQFALDSRGRLGFSSSASPQASLSIVADTTTRGVGGPSLSSFFGLGVNNIAGIASGFSLDGAIYQDPTRMAVGRLDLSVALGQPALALGDGRGGSALAAIGDNLTSFSAAGGLPAATMSLSRYASEMAGSLGRSSAAAENAKTSAASVQAEANTRRSSYEGVNMDEELIKLTTYQQAFNASARLIQAVNELYDTLLKVV